MIKSQADHEAKSAFECARDFASAIMKARDASCLTQVHWETVFNDELARLETPYDTNGVSPYEAFERFEFTTSEDRPDTVGSGAFDAHALVGMSHAYGLQFALWTVCNVYPQHAVSLDLDVIGGRSEGHRTRLSRILARHLNVNTDDERIDVFVRNRCEVFSRCVDIALRPKIRPNPVFTGKTLSYKHPVYGQWVNGLGAYFPNDAVARISLLPDFSQRFTPISELAEFEIKSQESKNELRHDCHMSRSTIQRALADLKEIGWIRTRGVHTLNAGRVRFVVPEIFKVAIAVRAF